MTVTRTGTAADDGIRTDGPATGESVDGGTVPPPREIRMVRPMPGLPHLERFVLSAVEVDPAPAGGDVLFELRSVHDPHWGFVAAAPHAFFPDYTVDLDAETCAELDLHSPDDALLLVLLTIAGESACTTANLMAPVVVNVRTWNAAQVILSGTDWPVRATVV
jgi:flagellar assembly factor FliW